MNVLFRDIDELISLENAGRAEGRGPLDESHLSVRKKQVMVCEGKTIVWVGELRKLPKKLFKIKKEVSLKGNVFPGFIDCHTHSVFAGNRRHEFEMRNQGTSYQEIARAGGGILATVKATRKATVKQLEDELRPRLQEFLRQGVTSIEIKSGYGLSVKEEIKILQSIQKTKHPIKRTATFLGAHALSPEFNDYSSYLDDLKRNLKLIFEKKLARRIDIFAEDGYFSVDQAKAYLREAQKIGFDITIHADQLTRTGAGRLAIEVGAFSADHLIRVNESDIRELARSSVTCVLLPASDFYIHCPYPPARQMIDKGCRVALSTDFNPGSSPTQNLQFVGLLARVQMKMSLPEVFSALTVGGAYALGYGKSRGVLAPGYDADFFVSPRDWDQFFYDLNTIPMSSVWIDGKKTTLT
jgi:imidazolonepropionase